MLLQKDYENFVFKFLTETKNEEENILIKRKELEENFGDWKNCLKLIRDTQELKDEKELLNALTKEKDYLGAIKNMKISSFFPHAYSSYIFNKALSKYIKNNKDNIEMEKIGPNTIITKENKEIFGDVLKEEEIEINDFKHPDKFFWVKNHPRKALFFPQNFKYEFNQNNLILKFDLGNGEYASLVLGFLFEGAFRKLD